MLRKSDLVLAAGALIAVSLSVVPRADACTGTPNCTGAWVFPVGGDIQRDRFTITYYSPASLSDGGVALPRLTRTVDGGVVDVPFEAMPADKGRLKLTPREVQPVGATILLETEQLANCALDELLSEQYHVIAPQPLPSSRGTLKASLMRGPLPVGVAPDTSCWAAMDAAYADVNVQLDPSTMPFASQFSYALVVDGEERIPFVPFQNRDAKPWSLAHGPARIYSICGVPPEAYSSRHPADLTPGKHTVRVQAKLDMLSLSTPEIEVELRCDGALPGRAARLTALPGSRSRGCSLTSSPAFDRPSAPAVREDLVDCGAREVRAAGEEKRASIERVQVGSPASQSSFRWVWRSRPEGRPAIAASWRPRAGRSAWSRR